MADSPLQITLTLEGQRAVRGVALDAFDGFIEHFIGALRYHYRASRAEVIKKTGRPHAEDQLVTAFRLVEFRTGSGVAVLEPPLSADGVQGMPETFADVPTLAWANVSDLLDAMDSGRQLEEPVVRELELATRSLGDGGCFSIEYRAPGVVRTRRLDDGLLTELRAPLCEERPQAQTITGLLHAIDLEPDKVGIRTPSGVDWTCRYPEVLEREVLAVLGSRVWAQGCGQLQSSRSGSLELEKIRAVNEFEQTELFTGPAVPLGELIEQQGVDGAQGISSLVDPDWAPGHDYDLFLEALID